MERLVFDPKQNSYLSAGRRMGAPVGTARQAAALSEPPAESRPASAAPDEIKETAAVEVRANEPANVCETNAEQGLARACVKPQKSIYPMYEPDEGLKRGTIFKALDLPLKGVLRCDA